MGWYDRERVVMSTRAACMWEVMARKLGNVHPGASFDELTHLDFVLSAGALVNVLGDAPQQPIGKTVWEAVCLRVQVTEQNTNLGIILLLTPLAACWTLDGEDAEGRPEFGRNELRRLLKKLTRKDSVDVYRAIRLAAPGGLGDAPEQDVRAEPTVTLLEAMRLAADRDQIARQYATGYADVFDLGVPAFLDGFERFGCVEAAVIHCQLAWLAAFPDSLIARKCGPAVAADVRDRATAVVAAGGLTTAEGRAAGVALDRHLRSDGNRLNPGTTADLVTACLFVALREGRVPPNAPFRWPVADWL